MNIHTGDYVVVWVNTQLPLWSGWFEAIDKDSDDPYGMYMYFMNAEGKRCIGLLDSDYIIEVHVDIPIDF